MSEHRVNHEESTLGGSKRVVIRISSVLRDGSDFDRVTFASIVRGIAYLTHKVIECGCRLWWGCRSVFRTWSTR